MMSIIDENKTLDMKILKDLFSESKLSFASEERMIEKTLEKPWYVSSFANINDKKRDIKVIFDDILKGTLIWFYLLQNDNITVL